MIRTLAVIAALLLPAFAAYADPPHPQVGDVYEISREKETSQRASDGSEASSTDQDKLIERVLGVSKAGLELEYDFPKDATAEDRASTWQFPVRVLKPPSGPMQLLNRAELEARVEAWLKTAGLPRAACGQWFFTWNAFRVECDPQSVIQTLEGFDLGPDDLRDGAPYQDPIARNPASLTRKAGGPDVTTFVAEVAIDPSAVRRERAEADVVAAEILKKPLTLDAALRARSAEDISGTIIVTFDTNAAGGIRQRTRLIKLNIKEPSGRLETQTVTEVLQRRLFRIATHEWFFALARPGRSGMSAACLPPKPSVALRRSPAPV